MRLYAKADLSVAVKLGPAIGTQRLPPFEFEVRWLSLQVDTGAFMLSDVRPVTEPTPDGFQDLCLAVG